MKICIKCGETKALSAFQRRNDGYRGECATCGNARKLTWAKTHPQNNKRTRHRYYAKKVGKHSDDCRRRVAVSADLRLEKKRAEYIKNRQRYLDAAKRYVERNKEVVAVSQRNWCLRNPERKAAVNKRWRERNAHRLAVHTSSRQKRRRLAMPAWLSPIQSAQIQEFYEIAQARTAQTGVEHHVDHVHPLQGKTLCGLHVPWNLQVLTATENHRKSARLEVA